MAQPTHQSDPLPIGYVETQVSWVGHKDDFELDVLLQEEQGRVMLEHPQLCTYGSRVDGAADGAGVWHYTLYAGFVPEEPLSPPLNPRNMNEAPIPRSDDPKAEDTQYSDGGLPMGFKEGQFGRGT